MENFITGFPGHETQHREAMLEVLGQEKYDFFFDKWLEYFFTAADAKYFSSLGLNCIRIPFNYRHFEDNMNPRVLLESGFKHLDRVIDLVNSFGIQLIRSDPNLALVCSRGNLHNPGYAYYPRMSKPRLALRQPNRICCFLGPQRFSGPYSLVVGANCYQV